MTLPDEYNSIDGKQTMQEIKFAIDFKPTITNNDYNNGFIKRYFIKMSNSSNRVYEVSKDTYSGIYNKIYTKVMVVWKITGPKNNVYTGNGSILQQKGVEEYNQEQISNAVITLPQLTSKIVNYLEFWRGC